MGKLLLTHPGYSAHVLTLRCRRDKTVRILTATNVSLLTVALTAMRQVEDHYRSLSRELTLAEWRRRAPAEALHRQRHAPDFSAATAALSPMHDLGQPELGEQRGIEEGADMRNALVCQRQHLDLERLM